MKTQPTALIWRRRLLYGAVTAVIVASFLAQILRGECPVP